MIFNSLAFLVFAMGFFTFWPRVRSRAHSRWIALTIASLLFYAQWDWRYAFLLVMTALVDYFAGHAIVAWPAWRRPFLVASLGTNVLVLAAFKYIGLLTAGLDAMSRWIGLPAVPIIAPALPAGLSFYTFQSMSYALDVYRGRIKPVRHVSHFLAFVSIWPHLVAGPIQRASHFLPQLAVDPGPLAEDDLWAGVRLIVRGYAKKLIIADNLAPAVNAAFGAQVLATGGLYWWVIMTMFAFQIYGDFSGYSDIARGLARWMGLNFSVNFDHPYQSASLQEFWTRWHISLSSWFRDYVYRELPVGERRERDLHRNLWITMVLSGLWHGAAVTFILWGALHAAFRSVERLTSWTNRIATACGRPVAVLLVMGQVWIGWVFFRAENLAQALRITGTMLDPTCFLEAGASLPSNAWFALALAVVREIGLLCGIDPWRSLETRSDPWAEPLALSLLVCASIYLRGPGAKFIYFQF